jgi:hypothetical protein
MLNEVEEKHWIWLTKICEKVNNEERERKERE